MERASLTKVASQMCSEYRTVAAVRKAPTIENTANEKA
jgi:hypothetical protein